MKFSFLILIILLFRTTDNIYYQNSNAFLFSNSKLSDSIFVSIVGKTYEDAEWSIKIVNSGRDTIYSYSRLFREYLDATPDEFEYFDEYAKDFISSFFDDLKNETTKDLPEYISDDQYYEENYQTLKISPEEYNKYRFKEYYIFSHPTYYEGWKVITYDQSLKKVIIISSGGL